MSYSDKLEQLRLSLHEWIDLRMRQVKEELHAKLYLLRHNAGPHKWHD